MTKPPIAGITSDLSLPEASVCTVMGPSMLGVPAVRFARGDLMHLIILECNMAWFWTVEHCDHVVSKHLCTTYKGYRVSGWKNKWRLTDRNWPIATRVPGKRSHIPPGKFGTSSTQNVLAGMGYGTINPAGLGKGQKRKKSWMPWRLAAHGRIWWSVCWLQCIHTCEDVANDFLMGKSCRKWCFCVLCLDFFQSFPIMILTNHHLTKLMSSHFNFGWVWDPRNRRSMTVCAW